MDNLEIQLWSHNEATAAVYATAARDPSLPIMPADPSGRATFARLSTNQVVGLSYIASSVMQAVKPTWLSSRDSRPTDSVVRLPAIRMRLYLKRLSILCCSLG